MSTTRPRSRTGLWLPRRFTLLDSSHGPRSMPR
ncbi:hypothetical protein IEO21_09666 [Rhodonia placenta]|uniref:Uncharacterized protein n=1 Tax=Rhodonia placenta TaxID=104341 RepID=A0A8H7TY77_9APHY|nr:hypothetical protein IEO21_09666 [Postia placenta]